MSTPAALLVTAVLLVGNAFFVGAEFAVTSARRSQLEPLAEAGDTRAVTALWALRHVSRMLATAQLGVTLCSTGLGVVAEPAIAHAIEPWLARHGAGQAGTHAVAVLIALVIVVYLHVVAGEMVPKNISISSPEKAVRWLAPPLVRVATVLGPVVSGLNGLANGVLRLLGIEPREEVAAAFNAQEVASIVERSTAEGVLEDATGLLSGALEFSEETAGSVMVPVGDLVTLPLDCTPEDVEAAVASTGYSRFPLVADVARAERPGQKGGREVPAVTGYLHLKDVLDADGEERTRPVPAWRARALVPVRAHDEIETALAAMQRTGAHLGRVEDAAGQVLGVVFLEDVLEELVGEVNDAMQRSGARSAAGHDQGVDTP
ncbi:HlyC/CorC family transporter [Actinomyces sp. 2119]|uniref:hemolysin family protein n=1 Tax=Actinomyces sp. 2119 TaxID=2321393 RepID=UPI000E6B559F|nr:hemolysin family protein [Actinomyces sp. 2119]RJF43249.1 HlyC/CorC family transporter [Actinomyces sp. 2119]